MTLSGNQMPRQYGRVLGRAIDQSPLAIRVAWLADTGSPIAVVRDGIGGLFDSSPTGVVGSGTNGGGGIRVVSGLAAEFSVIDRSGATSTVICSRWMGIKDTDEGDDLLGMDQLACHDVAIDWDPRRGQGALRIV
jgi:hypothetical protein